MKNLIDTWTDIWRVFTCHCHGKIITASVALVSVLDALFWAIFHQIKGSIPSVGNLHLIFWQIPLPFAVSRLWDVLLGPIFLVLLAWLVTSDFFYEKDADGGCMSVSSSLGTYSLLGLVAGFILGLVFGAVYIVPAFVGTIVALFAFCVGFALLKAFSRKTQVTKLHAS